VHTFIPTFVVVELCRREGEAHFHRNLSEIFYGFRSLTERDGIPPTPYREFNRGIESLSLSGFCVETWTRESGVHERKLCLPGSDQ